MRSIITYLSLSLLNVGLFSCSRVEIYTPIEDRIAAPIDVSFSPTEEYVYVLNADIDRSHIQGSIMVLDRDGNRVNQVVTPRMGRFLNVGEKYTIAGFEADTPEGTASVEVYDHSDERNPLLLAAFKIDCAPINAVQQPGYPYFAVSCSQGGMYVGEFEGPSGKPKLHLVRNYNYSRRALFIDPQRHLLLAFPTDMNRQRMSDLVLEDRTTYNPQTNEVEAGANEIPDSYEINQIQRDNLGQRRQFQFTVYNFQEEADKDFPYLSVRSEDADELTALEREFRWTYFSLFNRDGTPDGAIRNRNSEIPGLSTQHSKNYRTNFWQIQADTQDPNAFYMSQRNRHGRQSYLFGNNILKVRIIGPAYREDGSVPTTPEFLHFERIYGFAGQLDTEQRHFPGAFKVININGVETIIVNHFREFDEENRAVRYSSIAAAFADPSKLWHNEVSTNQLEEAYYQLAVSRSGLGFSCSFFSDEVIRFEVKPGIAINSDIKRIK